VYRVSDDLRDALAALNARFAELDAAEPPAKGRRAKDARAARVLAPYTAVAERWLATSTWPQGMEVGGVETVLTSLVDDAQTALGAGEPLYLWYGPAVPLVKFRLTRKPEGRRAWTREKP
jgi:hypothetical protein